MSRHHVDLCDLADRSHNGASRKRRSLSRNRLFLVLFLGFLLLSEMLGNGGFLVTPAHATSTSFSAGKPASLTFQQFLKMGSNPHYYHGAPVRSSSFPNPHNPHVMNTASLPPSAEPVTMKPISQVLETAFLAGGNGTHTLDLVGSDGRLEVQVAPGSLDVSHAAVAGGAAPSGTLTLQVSEVSGHFVGDSNLLGTYQAQIVDSKGQALSGIRVLAPVTIIYHYQPWEMDALNLDPGHLLLTWPALIAAARQAKQPTTDLIVPLHDDPVAHTLTAHSNVLAPSRFSLGGDANN
jgi:hypothetical protein